METTRRTFRVKRQDIHYLRTTVEAYDGMAVVRTMNPDDATIELLIAPGCEDLISKLVADLRDREGIPLEAVLGVLEERTKSEE